MANDSQLRILLVEDDGPARAALEDSLRARGFSVSSARSGPPAIRRIREETEAFDLVIVDLASPGMDVPEVLHAAMQRGVGTQVVIIASFSMLEAALESVRRGAADYLTKPFKFAQIEIILDRAVGRKRLIDENRQLSERVQSLYTRLDLLKENRDKLDRFIRETSEKLDYQSEKMDDCLNLLQTRLLSKP
jgi:DNA-binding NtrC family response regulator